MSFLPKTDDALRLIFLIAVQALCAAFFIVDAVADLLAGGLGVIISDWHWVVEVTAAVALMINVPFMWRLLIRALRRQEYLERNLSIASGALHEVIEEYFSTWQLTPSERDIAAFTLKGLSISDIAILRGSAEGTIKAHLSGIYRKAGVSGRSQLVSLLIEDLLNDALCDPRSAPAASDG